MVEEIRKKNIVREYGAVFAAAIFMLGCIDEFDISDQSPLKLVVIDGLITNEAGPYNVTVSTSSPDGNGEAVSGAIVVVSDDIGQTLNYFERMPGVYESDSLSAFSGRIGGLYQLNVVLPDGREYQSIPEVMVPVPQINSMGFVAKSRVVVTDAGNEVLRTGIEVSLNTFTTSTSGTFLRWDYRGIYLLHRPNACVICPQQCWVPDDQPLDNLLIEGTEVSQGGLPFNNIPIAFLTPDFKLDSLYVVWVKQYSLNQNAFNFWKNVKEQRIATGTIFDPTPSAFEGNMLSVTDPDELVLGYFGASAVATAMLNISRDELPDQIFADVLFPDCNSMDSTEPYCDDCTLFPNSRVSFPNDVWQ